MNSRVMRPAVCQPLAIRPPKGPLLAASGSVWNVCGSNWLGEGDYLICLDRDSAKEVDVAFNIILKVPIGDRTQKWHSGIHCLNTRLSRAKPIGAGQMILGVMSAWVIHVIPAIPACSVCYPIRRDAIERAGTVTRL